MCLVKVAVSIGGHCTAELIQQGAFEISEHRQAVAWLSHKSSHVEEVQKIPSALFSYTNPIHIPRQHYQRADTMPAPHHMNCETMNTVNILEKYYTLRLSFNSEYLILLTNT